MIRLNYPFNSGRFVSPHFLRTQTPDGKEFIVFSGVALVNLVSDRDGWTSEELQLNIGLESVLPPNQTRRGYGLIPEQWVPMITVNAFVLEDHSVGGFTQSKKYPGVAVDDFSINQNYWSSNPTRAIPLRARLAVHLGQSQLFRVAYHVTIIGRIEEFEIEAPF